LAFLDEIYPSLLNQRRDRIEIFDALLFTKMEDWEEYIPGITPIYHTPVVGVCHNSIWTVRESGHSAREFIEKR
jgi:hypothetical protein